MTTTDELLKTVIAMSGGHCNQTYNDYLATALNELMYDLAVFIEFKQDEQRSISNT